MGQSVTGVVQVRSEKQNVQMFREGHPHRPERNHINSCLSVAGNGKLPESLNSPF